jgi:hypothetical protein
MLWFANFFDEHGEAVTAVFTVVLSVSTALLWWSTRKLWEVTRDTAKRQERDTEILQRVYIAAELGGIRDMTNGQLVGHVVFRNVGHLPATNLRDLVKKIEVQDAAWHPPIIPDTQLEDHRGQCLTERRRLELLRRSTGSLASAKQCQMRMRLLLAGIAI